MTTMNFTTYPDIRSPFNRSHETNRLLPWDWATEEFAALHGIEWTWTEKLDGTNVRAMWDGSKLTIGGRTDLAQMSLQLSDAIRSALPVELLAATFIDSTPEAPAILYGEGVGPKIQKGGGLYCDKPTLVLFDVRVGPWWLKRESVEKVADKLSLPVASIVNRGTVLQAIEYVQTQPLSVFGSGRLAMEGVVGRPCVELFGRDGKRIIMKVKTKDFHGLDMKRA